MWPGFEGLTNAGDSSQQWGTYFGRVDAIAPTLESGPISVLLINENEDSKKLIQQKSKCFTDNNFYDDTWLADIQKGSAIEPKSVVLRNMFLAIQSHVLSNDLKWIKIRFELLDLKKMHPTAIVGIVRYSSVVRDKEIGACWKDLVEQSYRELCSRNLDANRMLKGVR